VDVRSHFLDHSKSFVTDHQKIIPIGSSSVFGRIYFFVGSIDSDTKNLDENSSSVFNVAD
jgi:hypothetical protein